MKSSMISSRNECFELDQEDSLAQAKTLFHIPSGIIYLDGNSLGVMPKSAPSRGNEVISQEWGEGLIRSWNTANWFTLPITLGNKISQLIGAEVGELVMTDTTSVNIFKVLACALRIQQQDQPTRKVIVSEREIFPTDLYIIQGMMDFLQQDYELRLIDDDFSIEEALDENVAVLLLSQVNYRTGYLHDLEKITALAHQSGALIIWDLCHSAGAVPIHLSKSGADFAVGCTYKYLNGSPGSPAYLWVADRHVERFWQPLSGWWGHNKPFEMAPQYFPAHDVRRFLCGTQPIVSMALTECGLDIALSYDMQSVREKSLALSDLFIHLVETYCVGHHLELITPRKHSQRGSHVSFYHPHGYEIIQALLARGVIGDYREPNVMRFGITPLYLGFSDIWDAVEILRDILENQTWREQKYSERALVT